MKKKREKKDLMIHGYMKLVENKKKSFLKHVKPRKTLKPREGVRGLRVLRGFYTTCVAT